MIRPFNGLGEADKQDTPSILLSVFGLFILIINSSDMFVIFYQSNLIVVGKKNKYI